MTELAVLTPSYAPDVELCRDLNASVLRWTPDDVHHHIVVPRRDKARFADFSGPRTKVWTVDDLLPRRMLTLPGANMWLNLSRPYPPVRGWVMQQVVKMQAATELGAELILLADSDVVLVRPVDAATFREDGTVRFYRSRDAIDDRLPRHIMWHDVARRLLQLPPAAPGPLPDYVSAFNVWDREVVRALLERIEAVAGRSWLDTVASRLHVSEFILYGVFVDEVLGSTANVFTADSMLCHNHWDPEPLPRAAAARFLGQLEPDDVAVMISAKSGTTLDVRRELFDVPVTKDGSNDAQARRVEVSSSVQGDDHE